MSRYADVSFYDSMTTQDNALLVRFLCRLSFAEATVSIKGKTSQWLLSGKYGTILDAGGAMDNILEETLSDLEINYVPWLKPWAEARAKVANFISFDINRKIIEKNLEEDNPQAIQKLLNGSVSDKYISEAIDRLSAVFSKIKENNYDFFAVFFSIFPTFVAFLLQSFYAKLWPQHRVPFTILSIWSAMLVCLSYHFLFKWMV